MTDSQPSLFDRPDPNISPELLILSPSEEFRFAHPDAPIHNRTRETGDHNDRRSSRLRDSGVGGGIADAFDGIAGTVTETVVSVSKTTPVKVRRRPLPESRYGDSELDTAKPDYFDEPKIPTPEEIAIGKAALSDLRKSGVLKPRHHGRGPGF